MGRRQRRRVPRFVDGLDRLVQGGREVRLVEGEAGRGRQWTKAISRAFFGLGARQDWVYRGKGIKVGNAKEAIFWTPAGNGKYRVIYGDLSVRQADKKELPAAK